MPPHRIINCKDTNLQLAMLVGASQQGPAGDTLFVTSKPVWARPNLSSCNGLLSNCKTLYVASELQPPLSRYKGDNYNSLGCVIGITQHDSDSGWDAAGVAMLWPICPANCLAKGVCNLLNCVIMYDGERPFLDIDALAIDACTLLDQFRDRGINDLGA
jgi:hypothetical protein